MKVTIVGYWGGYPGVNEATSGYLFEHENYNLLVDCGSAVLSQLQQYIQVEDLNAVILSHYHHDHIADIGPLQYAKMISNVLGKEKKEGMLTVYGHPFNHEGLSKLSYKGATKGVAYDPNKELEIGPFKISFMKTNHPVDCFAMRITTGDSTIVYTADSAFLNDFIPFALDADLLITECNLYGDQDGSKMGHMTSTEAGQIAVNANVKELILTHLPHFGNHIELITQAAAIYKGPIRLAKSGLKWEG